MDTLLLVRILVMRHVGSKNSETSAAPACTSSAWTRGPQPPFCRAPRYMLGMTSMTAVAAAGPLFWAFAMAVLALRQKAQPMTLRICGRGGGERGPGSYDLQ